MLRRYHFDIALLAGSTICPLSFLFVGGSAYAASMPIRSVPFEGEAGGHKWASRAERAERRQEGGATERGAAGRLWPKPPQGRRAHREGGHRKRGLARPGEAGTEWEGKRAQCRKGHAEKVERWGWHYL